MAGLIRRIAVRQVGPGSAGPEDPKDAIEYRAMLPPGTSSTVWPARQRWQEGPNEGPLLIREVTGMTGSGGRPDRMALRHGAGSVNTTALPTLDNHWTFPSTVSID